MFSGFEGLHCWRCFLQVGLQWFLTASGEAATTHLEAGAFIRSRPGVEHPDIQYHFLPSVVINHGSGLGDCHAFQVTRDGDVPPCVSYVYTSRKAG